VRRYPLVADLVQAIEALQIAPQGSTLAELAARIPGMPRNRLSVTLSLLRDGGLAACDASHGWRRNLRREATADRLGALAGDYAKKSERDHDALARRPASAAGRCCWRASTRRCPAAPSVAASATTACAWRRSRRSDWPNPSPCRG